MDTILNTKRCQHCDIVVDGSLNECPACSTKTSTMKSVPSTSKNIKEAEFWCVIVTGAVELMNDEIRKNPDGSLV